MTEDRLRELLKPQDEAEDRVVSVCHGSQA